MRVCEFATPDHHTSLTQFSAPLAVQSALGTALWAGEANEGLADVTDGREGLVEVFNGGFDLHL